VVREVKMLGEDQAPGMKRKVGGGRVSILEFAPDVGWRESVVGEYLLDGYEEA